MVLNIMAYHNYIAWVVQFPIMQQKTRVLATAQVRKSNKLLGRKVGD